MMKSLENRCTKTISKAISIKLIWFDSVKLHNMNTKYMKMILKRLILLYDLFIISLQ